MSTQKYTRKEIAQLIDHAVLSPFASETDALKALPKCHEYGVNHLCLYPVHIDALRRYNTKPITLIAVIGFPGGMQSLRAKLAEVNYTLEADEFDVVINGGLLKDHQYSKFRDELSRIVTAAYPRPVKAIMECCYLTSDELTTGCMLACQAGVSYLKTSTGFGTYGARVEDVKQMRRVIRDMKSSVDVKAAGGIHIPADVQKFLAAGATRIGTSHTFDILDHWPKENG